MVIDWVLSWLATSVAWLGTVIQAPGVPSFIADLPGYVATAAGYMVGTGPWIPWALATAVVGAYLACLAAGIALKLARIVASFLTLGGGSAA